MSWIRSWNRDRWNATRPMQRSVEGDGGGGALRYVEGVGAVIFGGALAGYQDLTPRQEPPPEPTVKVRALQCFCIGNGRDVVADEEFELPRRHALRVIGLKLAERIVDEIDLRARASMRRAERRDALERARKAASPPPPAPAPLVADLVVPEGERVRCRALRNFSLGGGHDLVVGDVFECDQETALYRIARGLAEAVEDAPAPDEEKRFPDSQSAPITRRGRSDPQVPA